ncbi:MAG: hypothetical protein GX357_09405 [Firmicutes bacterium]|nr:hypothetical protein [Bacillota bacterium]
MQCSGNKKGKKRRVVLFIICALLATVMIADYFFYYNRIYPGVYFEELSLGGQKKKDAVLQLEKYLQNLKFNQNIVAFTGGDEIIVKTFAELGIKPDVTRIVNNAFNTARGGFYFLNYFKRFFLARKNKSVELQLQIDYKKFTRSLQKAAAHLQREPTNAKLVLADEHKTVAIEPDVPGRRLDPAATYQHLQKVNVSLSTTLVCPLFFRTQEAEITAAQLEKLQIREEISSFTTYFTNHHQNRLQNIRLAAEAVDETILYPGEEFSFNQTVGDTTAEKGYLPAPVIVGGEITEGLGGGVCQVSTTLYNAALFANLEILERRNHGLYVDYVPPGLDATIAYGLIDLRFKNSHPYAIWIKTFVATDKLTVSFFSTKIPGQKVEIYTTDVKKISPPEKFIETDNLPTGERKLLAKGKAGYEATVWRVVSLHGREVKKEYLSQDVYKPVPVQYLLGTGVSSGKKE